MLGFDALGTLALGQAPVVSTSTQSYVFGLWGKPVKAGISAAVIATSFVGFVAPPQPTYAGPFTQFSQPMALRVNLPEEQPSALLEIAPPVSPVAVFAKFSEPRPIKQFLAPFTNVPQSAFVQPYVFSQFSQVQPNRTTIPDEQPSALFEVLLPTPPPFTGFARFEAVLRAKYNVALFAGLSVAPPVPPALDTHDGVWVKRKKRRSGPDPIDVELAEKASRRAALELAIYGPEVEYTSPAPAFEPTPAAPANVAELAKIVASVQAAHYQANRVKGEQDEEDDLEAILREIL